MEPPPVSTFDPIGLMLRARRRSGLAQRDLAIQLGVAPSLVAMWESGTRRVPLETFVQILQVGSMTLHAHDEQSGERVEPVSPDTLRDAAGRLVPAHAPASPRAFRRGLMFPSTAQGFKGGPALYHRFTATPTAGQPDHLTNERRGSRPAGAHPRATQGHDGTDPSGITRKICA